MIKAKTKCKSTKFKITRATNLLSIYSRKKEVSPTTPKTPKTLKTPLTPKTPSHKALMTPQGNFSNLTTQIRTWPSSISATRSKRNFTSPTTSPSLVLRENFGGINSRNLDQFLLIFVVMYIHLRMRSLMVLITLIWRLI